MKDEFIEFLKDSNKVPKFLNDETKELLLITSNPKKTVLKFYLLQLLGMFLTLFICPQYGIRSIGFDGIAGFIMDQGPVICALFCSFVLFAGGLTFSFLFLKRSELKWIFLHKLSLIIPFNSTIFFFLMLTKDMIVDEHSIFPGYSFDVTWFVTSIIVGIGMLELIKYRQYLSRIVLKK